MPKKKDEKLGPPTEEEKEVVEQLGPPEVDGPTYEKKVILTSAEQEIASFVERAGDHEPPVIEDMEELFTRVEMQIPKDIKRPEYAYMWLDRTNLGASLWPNGPWVPVTRSNHSHVHRSYFADTGAVQYRGQMILAFQRRETAEGAQKRVEREFNEKLQRQENKEEVYYDAAGNEIGRLERVQGNELGPAQGNRTAVLDDSGYDYQQLPGE
jgi:hypothetical protein